MSTDTTRDTGRTTDAAGTAARDWESSACPDVAADCRDLRLEAEAGKLTPHFLLNSLQAVAVLMDTGRTEDARSTVTRLSALLRHQLDADLAGEESLGDQVEFVRQYVQVERLRHDSELELDVAVDDEAARAVVPTRLLQPLVENAARHGLAGRDEGGRIEVRAERRDGRLRLRVRDDGRGLPEGWELEENAGIGLGAIRASLCRLHEGRHRFEVRDLGDGRGTEVEVDLPYRDASE